MVAEKQHRLAFFGQHRRDLAQIVDKAHVEHLVRFVQHKETSSCAAAPHGGPSGQQTGLVWPTKVNASSIRLICGLID